MNYPQWKYNGLSVTEVTDMPENAVGFVYEITTTAGKKYIGKKSLYKVRKRKFGKKESKLITDKRLKHYEMVKSESDWRTYTGSNKELNEDIKNGTEFVLEILEYAFNKKQLSYLETKHLFIRGVLESENYYNSNILGKFYKTDTI